MRISVFPKGDLDSISVSRTMTVFEWITKASALAADGLELYSGMLWQNDDDYLDAIGEALDSQGFEMPMLCTSPDFKPTSYPLIWHIFIHTEVHIKLQTHASQAYTCSCIICTYIHEKSRLTILTCRPAYTCVCIHHVHVETRMTHLD
jgi:sugar phosphate isomerase/epimerase